MDYSTATYLYINVNVEPTMKRINVMVSDTAKEKILKYQEDNHLTTLDESMDKFILEK